MPTSKYIEATQQEKDAFIEAYIERRKDTWDKRTPRYNGKGRGRAPRGTISVRAALRKKARDKWADRVRRAKKSTDKERVWA